MKTKFKKYLCSSVALILSSSILVSAATGCRTKGEPADEKQVEASASVVAWSESGEFTTLLTSDEADLSNVEKSDVEVVTYEYDMEAYSEALKEASSDEEVSSINVDDYSEKTTYPVTKLEKKDDGLEVTFKDDKAASKEIDSYTLEIEKENISTPVLVSFPVPTIKANVDGVLSTDENPEIVLSLESGLFAEEVTADQISLAGSFAGMEVEKVTAKSNKLTLKLKGKVSIPEGQGFFVDGIIGVNEAAMENERMPGSVNIPIKESLVTFDSEKMTVDGNKVTVPLNVVGGIKTDEIKPENITFGDKVLNDDEEDTDAQIENHTVKVTGVENKSDTQILLTMEVDGIDSRNAAAEALDGRPVQVGDTQAIANFPAASFYPLFDYIEQDGENFNINIEIGAQNGTLPEKLETSQFSCGGEFEDAKIVSVDRKDDKKAVLKISVPTNGQKSDEFSYNGSITMKAGALVNSWGDASSTHMEYLRNYSQNNIGRDGSLLMDKALNFAKISKGLNIASGAIMGVTIGFSLITMFLQMGGAIKDATQQALDYNKNINDTLDDIFEQLDRNNDLIEEIGKIQDWQRVQQFNVLMADMRTYCEKLRYYYTPEKVRMLGYEPIEIKKDDPQNVKTEKIREFQKIAKAVFDAEKSNNREISLLFRDYRTTYYHLKDYYDRICALLKSTGDTNPLNTYLKLTCNFANFDTSLYNLRKAYIDTIQTTVLMGYTYINLFNLRSSTVNDDGTLKLKTVVNLAEKDYNKVVPEMQKIVDDMNSKFKESRSGNKNQDSSEAEVESGSEAEIKSVSEAGVESEVVDSSEAEISEEDYDITLKDGFYESAYCYTFGITVNSFDSANANVFWAENHSTKDPYLVLNVASDKPSDMLTKQRTAWLKGTSAFVYSLRDDAEEVIKETSYAPEHLGGKFWGETFFSAKAPDGLPENAIYNEDAEDIMRAKEDKFVSLMQGRNYA